MDMGISGLSLRGWVYGGAVAVPVSIPNDAALQLWLKADAGLFQQSNGTTPAAANGDVVGYWADQSGNARHCTQATTAAKPTLATSALNGLPVVRLTSVSSNVLLSIANGLALSGAFTIYAVGTTRQSSSGSSRFTPIGSSVTQAGITLFVSNQLYILDNVGAAYAAPVSVTPPRAVQMSFRRSAVGVGVSTRCSGTAETGPGSVLNTLSFDTIGARPSPSQFTEGDFAEIIVYSRELTPAERTQVETYLLAKWGVAF
jgi:hypothetical protein